MYHNTYHNENQYQFHGFFTPLYRLYFYYINQVRIIPNLREWPLRCFQDPCQQRASKFLLLICHYAQVTFAVHGYFHLVLNIPRIQTRRLNVYCRHITEYPRITSDRLRAMLSSFLRFYKVIMSIKKQLYIKSECRLSISLVIYLLSGTFRINH